MKLKKGDNIIIITGKDKGKKGKIVRVLVKDNKVIIEGLKPLQLRYKEMTSDPNYIDSVLTHSADNLRPIAVKTLNTVKERMGLG